MFRIPLKVLAAPILVMIITTLMGEICRAAAGAESLRKTCTSLHTDHNSPAMTAPKDSPAAQSATDNLAQVCGVSIKPEASGTLIINIATSDSVPYRVFRLHRPDRLVVDFRGARNEVRQKSYSTRSQVLSGVRVAQFKESSPATVRVVSDLRGNPTYEVNTERYGIRIALKPRAALKQASSQTGKLARTSRRKSSSPPTEVAQLKGASPGSVFSVHKFADLSASLTRPELPPQDQLVPLKERPLSDGIDNNDAAALVYGISIKPNLNGETSVDIASTRSIPYRVFQLADPYRLVVDLKDARNASQRPVFPVDSEVLKRVRIAQWRADDPAVVRIVADLEGLPLFDVHAQQPGIRIDLKPRQIIRSLFRNPFQYPAQQNTKFDGPSGSAMTSDAGGAASAPGMASKPFSNLKVLGYVQQPGLGTEAIISDSFQIYFVPEGGTFEDHFRLITMSPEAVKIEDLSTGQDAWLEFTP